MSTWRGTQLLPGLLAFVLLGCASSSASTAGTDSTFAPGAATFDRIKRRVVAGMPEAELDKVLAAAAAPVVVYREPTTAIVQYEHRSGFMMLATEVLVVTVSDRTVTTVERKTWLTGP